MSGSFDLRWVLFGLLSVLLATAALAVVFDRWLSAARRAGLPSRAALDRAPFGWLVLTKTDRYRYANPYARRLLGLPAERGRIPVADWSAQMFDDVDTARNDPASGGRYRVMRVGEDRFASWWAFPQANEDVVYLLDVTAQQHSEEASRRWLRCAGSWMARWATRNGIGSAWPAARAACSTRPRSSTRCCAAENKPRNRMVGCTSLKFPQKTGVFHSDKRWPS